MDLRVAILVDGDNISAPYAAEIWDIGARYGAVEVVRVYGNAICNFGWQDAIGYRMIHTIAGKNVSDMLLSFDAMDIATHGKTDVFIIASSGRDFSHLARRIREQGIKVIGVGEARVPQSYRAVCSEFIQVGPAIARAVKCNVSQHPTGVTEIDAKIRKVIAANSQKGLGVPIEELSVQMKQEHETQISTYLGAHAGLYDLDPRGSGAMVRLKPERFRSISVSTQDERPTCLL